MGGIVVGCPTDNATVVMVENIYDNGATREIIRGRAFIDPVRPSRVVVVVRSRPHSEFIIKSRMTNQSNILW